MNHLYITSDTPKCKRKEVKTLLVRRNHQVVLSCVMDADPLSDIRFRWTFNTSDIEKKVKVKTVRKMYYKFFQFKG